MKLARFLLLVAVLSLTACGFHLRGRVLSDVKLPFKALYLKVPTETPFVIDLRKALKLNNVPLTTDPKQADLVLEVVSEHTSKQILSLNSSGAVQEYQLNYRVSLRAYDSKQTEWLPPEEISLSRNMTYDASQVYAMSQEEAAFYNDMRSDAVTQTVRRLYMAKPRLDAQ
jgi:LPS-assembly lipoprotein